MRKTTTSSILATLFFVAITAAVASAQPASFIDLGVIGTPGSYTFDTNGSMTVPDPMGTGSPAALDTVLGLYDMAGNVIDSNDDNGAGGLWSQIPGAGNPPLTLPAGMFFLGASEFSSTFEADFVNSGTGFEADEVGNVLLNINGVLAGSGMAGDADTTAFDETIFFKVTIEEVPEPAPVALLAMAGLAFCLMGRRRK